MRYLFWTPLLLTICIVSNASSQELIGSVEVLDETLTDLVSADAQLEVLAEGFVWSEGPVWVSDGEFLLFSDVPTNQIYHWSEGNDARIFLEPSGYTGPEERGGSLGSNGLTLDSDGNLIITQHGDRRIARLGTPLSDPEPMYDTVVDRYEGARYNSPNDLVYHSNGMLYFTDPPYGLELRMEDPSKELDFHGVFSATSDGTVTLLEAGLSRPNGLAFSPDEKTLYVANSDPENAIWMAYDVLPDGGIENGRVFFDATSLVEDGLSGLPDGLKVDLAGNLFATGPGGVLVFNPEGVHLGTINTTQATANCAFGDDGKVLYITADGYLLRIPLLTEGAIL
ncbi:MAG: SMP-30/gluconolactonase/LRE family protein [Rhodothermaceae bacterium]|nr:SMP-30/gluconolactonase/LRE family protein [Bacteroidota bacterium]MXW15525.1 SMP-30/gluconolactonase/LRE family protein [Rhodothermaceae bacterium]MDE2645147.1 SMP-30/gluconolactonase/LRE family protein [Bacteroidota bacterium]MXW33377.1 SMP-30/gluconolactonase/LRE family protein [Rhodothermaceae bacterium]MXX96159.1 SMP-30/gluconolactonase/LRE family protein [Rhodothermaceae bacterium]